MNKELEEHIIEEMKWLKKTFHTSECLKPEFQKWLNIYAEERHHELEATLKFAEHGGKE